MYVMIRPSDAEFYALSDVTREYILALEAIAERAGDYAVIGDEITELHIGLLHISLSMEQKLKIAKRISRWLLTGRLTARK